MWRTHAPVMKLNAAKLVAFGAFPESASVHFVQYADHFQRTGSTCTLPCVLLRVMAPSCTVACSCMLRSAS